VGRQPTEIWEKPGLARELGASQDEERMVCFGASWGTRRKTNSR